MGVILETSPIIPDDDEDPAWLGPTFAVSPAGKKITMWGRLKQIDR